MSDSEDEQFPLQKHVQFFKLHYNLMPQPYQSQECNHMMFGA
jgi:hypothetical protein